MGRLTRAATWVPRRLARQWLALLPANLREATEFEAKSAWGRLRAPAWTNRSAGPIYLNVGGGLDRFPGFVTVDFFGTPGAFEADLRFPLRIPDGIAAGIFTEHAVEHFTYEDAA